jgi:murein DD-endopeptidase MepM/ murein hydrolase activator NlpD
MRGKVRHGGIDLLYEAPPKTDLPRPLLHPWVTKATKSGRRWFVTPDTPVLAYRPGRVIYARRDRRGHSVRLSHESGPDSYYTHMTGVYVTAGQTVRDGDPLGLIGDDPASPRDVAHLHFGLYAPGGPVDPAPLLKAAGYAPWVQVAEAPRVIEVAA